MGRRIPTGVAELEMGNRKYVDMGRDATVPGKENARLDSNE